MTDEHKINISKALRKKYNEDPTYKQKIVLALTNRLVSQRTRDKIKISNTGKKHSKETIKKMSESHMGNTAHLGFKHSDETKEKIRQNNLGKKQTLEQKLKQIRAQTGRVFFKETKEKISQSHIGMKASEESKQKMAMAKKGKPSWNKGLTYEGRPCSKETKRKMSESMKKAWQNPITRDRMNGKGTNGTCKTGFREDIGINVKSRMEANYIRVLNYLNIKWEYETEKCVFNLLNGNCYICDFYLPDMDCYVELKGYMRLDAQEKINMFKQEYQNVKYKLIEQYDMEWNYIVLEYAEKIPNWEYCKKEKCLLNRYKKVA